MGRNLTFIFICVFTFTALRPRELELYEKIGEDQNRWHKSPWANAAYPAEHWELLTIWTKRQ